MIFTQFVTSFQDLLVSAFDAEVCHAPPKQSGYTQKLTVHIPASPAQSMIITSDVEPIKRNLP